MHHPDELLLPPLRGRFAFAEDEGFRVTFRRADGAGATALAWALALAVVGVTLRSLLGDPDTNGIAWMIGGLVDFAALYVIFTVRRMVSTGGISVDGAERRIFLPAGAEMVFERLHCVTGRPAARGAELAVVHDTGTLDFGVRPEDETRRAAELVARVTELPLVPWETARAEAAGQLDAQP